MSYAIITGRRTGDKGLTVILPPTDPRAAADAFKGIVRNPGDIEEVQLLDSRSGVVRRKKFQASASVVAAPAPIPAAINDEGPSLLPPDSKSKKSK